MLAAQASLAYRRMDLRLVFLVVFFAAAYAGDYPYTRVPPPKCDEAKIEQIKKIWEKYGIPQKIFTELGVKWTFVRATPTRLWTTSNCVSYFTAEQNLLFVRKDEKNGTVSITQKDGVLQMEGDNDQHWIIRATDGAICFYTCSTDGPEPGMESDIAYVLASPHATTNDIDEAVKLEESLGLKMEKKFVCHEDASS